MVEVEVVELSTLLQERVFQLKVVEVAELEVVEVVDLLSSSVE